MCNLMGTVNMVSLFEAFFYYLSGDLVYLLFSGFLSLSHLSSITVVHSYLFRKREGSFLGGGGVVFSGIHHFSPVVACYKKATIKQLSD